MPHAFPTNFGEQFQKYGVGLQYVTVKQCDPDTDSVTATAEDVAATVPTRTRAALSVGGGELGSDTRSPMTFRADLLGFVPKPNDTVTEADGTVWIIESAKMDPLGQLCSADVVIARG